VASSALGEVLELAGRKGEARAAYEEALGFYERKEARPEVDAIRARLDALGD
jgi:predicted negative regulator of RcsB-dependent stress response